MADYFALPIDGELEGVAVVDRETGGVIFLPEGFTAFMGLVGGAAISFVQFDLPDGKLLLHSGFSSAVVDPGTGSVTDVQEFAPGAKDWPTAQLMYDGGAYTYLVSYSVGSTGYGRAYSVDIEGRTMTEVWSGTGYNGYMDYPGFDALEMATTEHAHILSPQGALPNAAPPGLQVMDASRAADTFTVHFGVSTGDTITASPGDSVSYVYSGWQYYGIPNSYTPRFYLPGPPPEVASWRDFRNSREVTS